MLDFIIEANHSFIIANILYYILYIVIITINMKINK